LDELVLAKKTDKIVERVIERERSTSMNIWEFLDKKWWLVFPIGTFLWLIALAL
ncbi:transcriptional regulator, partial [Streptococcus vicugnae]